MTKKELQAKVLEACKRWEPERILIMELNKDYVKIEIVSDKFKSVPLFRRIEQVLGDIREHMPKFYRSRATIVLPVTWDELKPQYR